MKKILLIDESLTFANKTITELQAKEFEVISINKIEAINPHNKIDLIIFKPQNNDSNSISRTILKVRRIFNSNNKPIILVSNVTCYSGYNFDPANRNNYALVNDLIENEENSENLIFKIKTLLEK